MTRDYECFSADASIYNEFIMLQGKLYSWMLGFYCWDALSYPWLFFKQNGFGALELLSLLSFLPVDQFYLMMAKNITMVS